jgi:acetoin utilization protein AcuB
MKLKEVMRASPQTIEDTMHLGDAHRLMRDLKIRHLPVIRAGKLCGILSSRDILRYRATAPFRDDWWRAPVSAAMVAHPQTANPEDSLTEAAGRLAASQIGALPIVDKGALIGIVTVTDVLDAEVRVAMA